MRFIATIFVAALAAMSFTHGSRCADKLRGGAHGLMPTGGFETDFGAGVEVIGMYPMNDDGLETE